MLHGSTAQPVTPLECPHCRGFGTFRGDLPCDRCRCTGLVQCDHCDEHPSDAPAIGCDPTDTDIKLCASCIAKPCEWCGKALSDAEAHEQCFPDVPEWDGVGPDDPRTIRGDCLRDQQRDAHVGGR